MTNNPAVAATLLEYYAPAVNNDILLMIRQTIGASSIWVSSVDDTEDAAERYIANMIVGKLSRQEPGPGYLLTCEHLEKGNGSRMAQLSIH